MKRLQRERKLPPLPLWFEARAVLRDSDVEIEEEGTRFRLRRQTVVVGLGGLFVLSQIPLREGSAVRLWVGATGSNVVGTARVESIRLGLGTVFRFSPAGGQLRRRLKQLLHS